jgi:hypothetical protein
MKKLSYFLTVLVAISPLGELSGKESSPSSLQDKTECAEQIKERTAAIRMEDWPQLDRIARRFIQSCGGIFGRRDIASAFSSVASANNEMGRFEEALAQANAGIATHYLEPSNHLEKAKALLSLHDMVEAKKAFRIADHVLHLAIEQNEQELRNARDADKELHLVHRELYQSEILILEKYRPLLGD